MTELDQLKTLLLADELEEIKQLASKLRKLEFESYDESVISTKILPLFDTILLKKLEDKESHTIQILSQHLAQVILESGQKDLPGLSQSLQTVISPAISREIEENKDKMVDTLYPIMGGMISKYVTHAIKEMMESINTKIEDGLSFNRYKRKVKAKVTGVSETELLLQESNEAQISALFIIHKESGLLISESHLEDYGIDDPHMVASMASAIKDFINDWIQTHETESTQEVQLMSYGEATLYIESAGSVYLIAFLDAEPTQEQRSKINLFFAKIIKSHSTYLQGFNGDDTDKTVKDISAKMYTFLLSQNKHVKNKEISIETKEKKPLKLILFLLGIALIGYLLYQWRYSYADYILEKRILEVTEQPVTVTHKEGKYYLSGSVDSMEHFYTVKKLLDGHAFTNALQMPIEDLDQKLLIAHQRIKELNNTYISHTQVLGKELHMLKENTHTYASQKDMTEIAKNLEKETKKLQVKITQLEKKLQKSATGASLTLLKNKFFLEEKHIKEKITQLEKKFDHSSTAYRDLEDHMLEIEHIANLRSTILKKLSTVFHNDTDLYREDGSLDFRTKKLFDSGAVIPNLEALKNLEKYFILYVNTLMSDKEIRPYIKSFIIEGYTDSIGDLKYNKALSYKRANQVKTYLLTLPVSKNYQLKTIMHTRGMGNKNAIRIYGVEDKEASRRIKLRFELNSEKIINRIKSSIDD